MKLINVYAVECVDQADNFKVATAGNESRALEVAKSKVKDIQARDSSMTNVMQVKWCDFVVLDEEPAHTVTEVHHLVQA